jgi:hypothetical protein
MIILRRIVLALLVASPIVLSFSHCDFLKDESCFIDRKLVNESGDDLTYHVGMRFRVFVHNNDDIPVQGVRVEFHYWKLHCNGTSSYQFKKEGETNENGVFSTELTPTYNTFKIDTFDDEIRIRMSARISYQSVDAQAHSWSDNWVYNQTALSRLPLSGTSSGAYRERMLNQETTLVYPWPK